MTNKRIEYEFDNARFMADIREAIGDRPSLRDIEAVTGVSASTWSRVDNGTAPDMDGFMQTCSRLNLMPGNYFKRVIWQRVEDDA